jgi:uncharacterized protein (DUF433 family)
VANADECDVAQVGRLADPIRRTAGLPMQLEDYFNFLSPDEIRIRGHRINIEDVLYEYIHRSRTPEQIVARFDTLTLDEVYATILYYLRNRQAIDTYMADWLEHGEAARQAQERDPAFHQQRERLRRALAERPPIGAPTPSNAGS